MQARPGVPLGRPLVLGLFIATAVVTLCGPAAWRSNLAAQEAAEGSALSRMISNLRHEQGADLNYQLHRIKIQCRELDLSNAQIDVLIAELERIAATDPYQVIHTGGKGGGCPSRSSRTGMRRDRRFHLCDA